MAGSVDNFLIKGHQKVIGHYQLLLKSARFTASDRRLIESRLAKEEQALEGLIASVWKGEVAA